MKSYYLILIASFVCAFEINAQNDSKYIYYPDRYLLDLPDEWKKPKLIDAISSILPQTLDEYIDSSKKFCLDCKAGLTVFLIITPAVQVKGEESFQFSAALGLFDTSGKELIELSLISPEEKHDLKVTLEYRKQPGNQYNTYQNNRVGSNANNNNITRSVITGPNGRVIGTVRSGGTAQLVNRTAPVITNNIPTVNKKSPSIYELMLIAEARIYEIQKILTELKQKEEPIKE